LHITELTAKQQEIDSAGQMPFPDATTMAKHVTLNKALKINDASAGYTAQNG